jgi:hypothetical protein
MRWSAIQLPALARPSFQRQGRPLSSCRRLHSPNTMNHFGNPLLVEVRMLSTLALMAIRNSSRCCEHALGIRLDADFAPTQALLARLRAGERPDLVVLTVKGSMRRLVSGWCLRTLPSIWRAPMSGWP